MYIIQTRSDNPTREIMESFNLSSESEWRNYKSYERVEDAEKHCESMIQKEMFKTSNIRIVEVVRVFDADFKVNIKNTKKQS